MANGLRDIFGQGRQTNLKYRSQSLPEYIASQLLREVKFRYQYDAYFASRPDSWLVNWVLNSLHEPTRIYFPSAYFLIDNVGPADRTTGLALG